MYIDHIRPIKNILESIYTRVRINIALVPEWHSSVEHRGTGYWGLKKGDRKKSRTWHIHGQTGIFRSLRRPKPRTLPRTVCNSPESLSYFHCWTPKKEPPAIKHTRSCLKPPGLNNNNHKIKAISWSTNTNFFYQNFYLLKAKRCFIVIYKNKKYSFTKQKSWLHRPCL